MNCVLVIGFTQITFNLCKTKTAVLTSLSRMTSPNCLLVFSGMGDIGMNNIQAVPQEASYNTTMLRPPHLLLFPEGIKVQRWKLDKYFTANNGDILLPEFRVKKQRDL